MSANKWVRSISFNKTNTDDIARLKLIGKKSFSRFIKKLMDDEIKRQSVNTTVVPVTTSSTATPQQPQKIIPQQQHQTVKPNQPLFNPMLRGRQS